MSDGPTGSQIPDTSNNGSQNGEPNTGNGNASGQGSQGGQGTGSTS